MSRIDIYQEDLLSYINGIAVRHGGTAGDQYGQTKAGFEVEGTINRKEFGLTWDAVTEAGNEINSLIDQTLAQLIDVKYFF